jgi:predicted nucleotidyltransferase component of viral defense system
MIYQQLEEIVKNSQKQKLQPLYIRSQLKEYLQLHLLYFIYTTTQYKNVFIFTGGTCLRHFYGIERLSEDVDFDLLEKINVDELKDNIQKFFEQKYLFSDVDISVKQQGKQILIKFPVLHKLGLANKNESDLLYIKMDLSLIFPKYYELISQSKSSMNLNFVARHYDLPTLMANKIHAIFDRKIFKGKQNKQTIKGRDYFDLLWFIKKGIKPNLNRLGSLIDNIGIRLSDVEMMLDEKVNDLCDMFLNDFELDLLPFISDPKFLNSYVKNYKEEYLRNKANSFTTMINLMVRCKNCGKEFNSGIAMQTQSFDLVSLVNNVHICPFCQEKNVLNKNDYIKKLS